MEGNSVSTNASYQVEGDTLTISLTDFKVGGQELDDMTFEFTKRTRNRGGN
jgi:hypothetical protein